MVNEVDGGKKRTHPSEDENSDPSTNPPQPKQPRTVEINLPMQAGSGSEGEWLVKGSPPKAHLQKLIVFISEAKGKGKGGSGKGKNGKDAPGDSRDTGGKGSHDTPPADKAASQSQEGKVHEQQDKTSSTEQS